MKKKKVLTARETLDRIAKQWATREDVRELSGAGYNGAIDLFDEIEKTAREKKLFIPKGKPKLVPMELVVEYLKINIDYLEKVSGFENNKED